VRVLIFEPHASGHHANYVSWLVEAARSKQWNTVIATSPAALSHPSLCSISRERDDVQIHEIQDFAIAPAAREGTLGLMRRELRYWQVLKKSVEDICAKTPVDSIILPYLDYCFYAIAALGAPVKGLPWCAISMRLAVTHDETNERSRMPWKWRIAKRILRDRNLKSIFVINPSVQHIPPNWHPLKLLKKIRYLADPADLKVAGSHSAARTSLGVSDTALAILAFGALDERKGIDSLLATLASEDALRNCVVILAGIQSPSMRTQMRTQAYIRLQAEKRLIVFDRFLSDAEQTLVFTAADVVWVGYRNHSYMSGVLVLAGKAGLPVVGTAGGEIGQLIARQGLGAVARIDHPADVSNALIGLLDPEARTAMGRKAREFFANHTVENFGIRVLGAFDEQNAKMSA
jgi:glycosyltransferase involved in cell wall biosynthesis